MGTENMGCVGSREEEPNYWERSDGVIDIQEEFYGINSNYGGAEGLTKPMPAGRASNLEGGLSSNLNLRHERGTKTVADHEYECVFPCPEGKPQTQYKCPPCKMEVVTSWWWMRDANDHEKTGPLGGFIVITLLRGEEVVAKKEIGPCKEITDEERCADEAACYDFCMETYGEDDELVKNVQDGDVFRFEYKVGLQGCQTAFKYFTFNIQWKKSEALVKELAEEASPATE